MAVTRAESIQQPRETTLRDFAAVCLRRKWVIFAVLAAALAIPLFGLAYLGLARLLQVDDALRA